VTSKNKVAYRPHWRGPIAYLHLREINGVPCLFDDQGRMISCRNVTVRAGVDEPVTALAEMILVCRSSDDLQNEPSA
jgi:hypothetical protein